MMGRKATETCRVVIPIKLDFRASVGFIHKESVTMHGHTIVKYIKNVFTRKLKKEIQLTLRISYYISVKSLKGNAGMCLFKINMNLVNFTS